MRNLIKLILELTFCVGFPLLGLAYYESKVKEDEELE